MAPVMIILLVIVSGYRSSEKLGRWMRA